MPDKPDQIGARRLWLPWRPKFRLIFLYPRCWHWVVVQLGRFDVWFTGRIQRWPLRRLWIGLVFLPWVAVRFLGLVAVFEITIVAFAASTYLVWGEWMLLLLLLPFVLLARLAHALPWLLTAHRRPRCWTTRITGWRASRQALRVALDAQAAGREPPLRWTETPPRPRIWT